MRIRLEAERSIVLGALLLVASSLGCASTPAPSSPYATPTPTSASLEDAPAWLVGSCRAHWADLERARRIVCGVGSAPAHRNRVAARETRRSERPASARASGGGRRAVGGTERRSDRASADSGESTASEEGRLKRGASSPESVLPAAAPKSGGGAGTGAATGGKRKAGATGSSGSGSDKEAEEPQDAEATKPPPRAPKPQMSAVGAAPAASRHPWAIFK